MSASVGWDSFRVREAKPVTTVQDCVSTYESVKLLDIFNETLGQFPSVCDLKTNPAVFVVTKEPTHDPFLILNQAVLHEPNQTMSAALLPHKNRILNLNDLNKFQHIHGLQKTYIANNHLDD